MRWSLKISSRRGASSRRPRGSVATEGPVRQHVHQHCGEGSGLTEVDPLVDRVQPTARRAADQRRTYVLPKGGLQPVGRVERRTGAERGAQLTGQVRSGTGFVEAPAVLA